LEHRIEERRLRRHAVKGLKAGAEGIAHDGAAPETLPGFVPFGKERYGSTGLTRGVQLEQG